MKDSTKGLLFIIFACLCWASDSYFRYPLLGQGFSSLTIVFVEHTFLVFLFFPTVYSCIFNKKHIFSAEIWFSFAVVGTLGSALATVCFTEAMHYINPSVVILLQKLQPICALIMARLFLKEVLSKQFVLFGLVALLGVLLLSLPDWLPLLSSQDIGASSMTPKQLFLGYFLALVAVVGWASATIFGKKIYISSKGAFKESEIMGLRYFWGWAALLPLFFMTDFSQTKSHDVGLAFFLSIGAMVAISALVGMHSYYRGVKILAPRQIVIAELWYPVAALLVNRLLLGVSLNPWQLVGAALLLVSTMLIQRKGL